MARVYTQGEENKPGAKKKCIWHATLCKKKDCKIVICVYLHSHKETRGEIVWAQIWVEGPLTEWVFDFPMVRILGVTILITFFQDRVSWAQVGLKLAIELKTTFCF